MRETGRQIESERGRERQREKDRRRGQWDLARVPCSVVFIRGAFCFFWFCFVFVRRQATIDVELQ